MNMSRTRDYLAWRLANAALRIATPWYRNTIIRSVYYGLDAALRDKED